MLVYFRLRSIAAAAALCLLHRATEVGRWESATGKRGCHAESMQGDISDININSVINVYTAVNREKLLLVD